MLQIVQKPVYFLIRFFKEVRIEMKRVNWLTRREVFNYTVVVIAISLAVGIYLGALDFLFSWLLGVFVL